MLNKRISEIHSTPNIDELTCKPFQHKGLHSLKIKYIMNIQLLLAHNYTYRWLCSNYTGTHVYGVGKIKSHNCNTWGN